MHHIRPFIMFSIPIYLSIYLSIYLLSIYRFPLYQALSLLGTVLIGRCSDRFGNCRISNWLSHLRSVVHITTPRWCHRQSYTAVDWYLRFSILLLDKFLRLVVIVIVIKVMMTMMMMVLMMMMTMMMMVLMMMMMMMMMILISDVSLPLSLYMYMYIRY